MRQIEKEMRQAIAAGRNWAKSNTEVRFIKNSFFVFLFGNLIFCGVNGVKSYSNCGYNTVTTASRLRALGVDYSKAAAADHPGMLTASQIKAIYYNELAKVF